MQVALELVYYKIIPENLLKIKKKLIKEVLELEEVFSYVKKNHIKDYYIYLFYNREGIIYTSKEILMNIIKDLDRIENDDIIYSDNEKLYEYNNIVNNKKIKTKDIKSLKLVNDKSLEITENIDHLHHSKLPDRIYNFLSIEPIFINFFPHKDSYEKNNLEMIDKGQLPHYKLLHTNKYSLLNILVNHCLNFTPEEIHYYMLNNKLPFINYVSLKSDLKDYYNSEKNLTYNFFKEDEPSACNYLLGRDHIILLKENNGYNVYSKEPEDLEEEKNMRKKYIEKINKLEKGYLVDYNNLSNKELINLEFFDSDIYSKEGFQNYHYMDNYHYGFFNNGIYKSAADKNSLNSLNIDPYYFTVKLLEEEMENYYTILLKTFKETIELNYFYIPKEQTVLMENLIIKLWKKGYLLTHFGKAVYNNEKEIIENVLVVPEWFHSENLESYKKLLKIISKIN